MIALMSSDDAELKRLRVQIDGTDAELLDVLKKRMKIVDQVGAYKKEHTLEPRDEKRRGEVLSDRVARGKSRGLSGEMVREIFETILKHSEEREGNN